MVDTKRVKRVVIATSTDRSAVFYARQAYLGPGGVLVMVNAIAATRLVTGPEPTQDMGTTYYYPHRGTSVEIGDRE